MEIIKSLEILCYYFGMKPNEFWDCKYSEIVLFCQIRLIRLYDDLRSEINLQEAVTNKLIAGDCMNQNSKILLIKDNYKELFEVEKEEQSLEEQRKLFKG